MAGSDELSMNWSDGSEDELVRELLDDESPFFFVPKTAEFESSVSPESIANPLISNVYSGPTIEDIETALSSTYRSNIDPGDQRTATSRPPVSLFEKGFGKMENKYTLKIKSSGNAMADDGYKWRKYGQKSIKNSPYPRSYYRCTNPRCSAKKQVERSKEDPEMLIVTYEGLHLHFAYSHFLVSRPNTDLSSTLHASKRPRISSLAEHPVTELQAQAKLDEGPALMGSVSATERQGISSVPPVGGLGRVAKANANNSMGTTTQGLLEDVVPMIVRNPSSQSLHSFDPSLLSCLPSPPLSSSSISITSSPTISHFDVGILAEM